MDHSLPISSVITGKERWAEILEAIKQPTSPYDNGMMIMSGSMGMPTRPYSVRISDVDKVGDVNVRLETRVCPITSETPALNVPGLDFRFFKLDGGVEVVDGVRLVRVTERNANYVPDLKLPDQFEILQGRLYVPDFSQVIRYSFRRIG